MSLPVCLCNYFYHITFLFFFSQQSKVLLLIVPFPTHTIMPRFSNSWKTNYTVFSSNSFSPFSESTVLVKQIVRAVAWFLYWWAGIIRGVHCFLWCPLILISSFLSRITHTSVRRSELNTESTQKPNTKIPIQRADWRVFWYLTCLLSVAHIGLQKILA